MPPTPVGGWWSGSEGQQGSHQMRFMWAYVETKVCKVAPRMKVLITRAGPRASWIPRAPGVHIHAVACVSRLFKQIWNIQSCASLLVLYSDN